MEEERHTIGKWVSIIHRYTGIYLEKVLKPYDLGRGQFIFLMLLFKEDGMSQEALSTHLNMDKATTARAVKKLVQAGYVKKEVDIEDKRAYRVYITKKALTIKPVIKKAIEEWTEVLLGDLSEEQQKMMIYLSKRVAQNACSFIQNKS